LKTTIRRGLAAALLALAAAVPAASAQTTGDSVQSDNVEHVGNLREVGTGVGATIVGDKMYVTSTHSLTIYDIKTNPAEPALLSAFTLDVQFENEEVPTNGKILGISSDTFCVVADPAAGPPQTAATGGCLAIYDVSDPANVKLLTNIPGAGNHTSACALDCTWMYGSEGSIIDLRDPAKGKMLDANWMDILTEQGWEQSQGCHHAREVTPGILLGSCQPLILMSIRPQDGGSPEHPILLSTGTNEDSRFIHSSRWPRKGLDKFVLVGGEQNATTATQQDPSCNDKVSAFMTWDGSAVNGNGTGNFVKGSAFALIDEVRPVNGTIQDGHSAYNILGCSVHWFEEHPTFKNGGLVALAEYENGTRFEQIEPSGKIVEQGYFLPTSGSTSAPHWNPFDPTIVYAVDYTRGVDILRYKGDTYVPNSSGQVVPDPSKVPGTNGKQPDLGTTCASAAGFNSAAVAPKGKKVTFKVNRREKRPFGVDVFQQTQGRKVIGNRLVARFKNKKKTFTWNGRDIKGRRLGTGNYFVRFIMKTASGARDTRRATLKYSGRFRTAPDFYQRVDCGAFKSLKLSSSAFGGSTNAALGVSYKLAIQTKDVTIQFKLGNKVIKKFTGKGEPNRTFRTKLPASKVKRGKTVKVVITANRPGAASPRITLAANRL
jgi:hypothetical protein